MCNGLVGATPSCTSSISAVPGSPKAESASAVSDSESMGTSSSSSSSLGSVPATTEGAISYDKPYDQPTECSQKCQGQVSILL